MKKVSRKKPSGPSEAALREMPEIDFGRVKVHPNPYAKRIAAQGVTLQVGRGRPKRGSESGPTEPRSVRFPPEVWKRLEKRAKREGIPLHAALRRAVLDWLSSDAHAT